MIEKIPYLQDLGITAVELMPVFQFDRHDCPSGLVNYWGYSPVSFFAPHAGYSSRRDPLGPVDEFRDLVKALHRAGIEVILDVVYNHTAEGDHQGPTLSFRGLDNATYYLLESDRARYANYTGTGNTLNANNAVVRRLIRDSLRYWVAEMHVDGFRFDLASVLTRDEAGRPLQNPPVLWDIQSDPILAGTKLIAEAWDAAGLYQVGSFFGDNWQEWNGKFRDDVRRFVKSDDDTVAAFAYRCFGSPDLYGHEERGPEQSINFVTCHDGFTLNDLVSYNHKHNEANEEGSRDGSDTNLSWNCGVEGPTDDPEIERLRHRQVKNLLAVTLLAVGTPMLSMGDEVRRTQRGNNNAYCQDNETSWFDWTLVERHQDLHRFVKMLIRQRLHARRPAGSSRPEPERAPERGRDRGARCPLEPSRHEPRVPQPRDHGAGSSAGGSPPRHVQRLLGTAGLRATTPRSPARVATLDRYLSSFARRRIRPGARALPAGHDVCGGAAVARDPGRGERAPRECGRVSTLKDKRNFPGLKKLLFPAHPSDGSGDVAEGRARALFLPPEGPVATRHRSLVHFLGQVSLFEGFGRGDLSRLARIIHEREYVDGECICEEGKPGAALFIVRRGVVRVVSGTGAQEVPIALLEPPATFEESAAIGTSALRWFSVRARGPVSLLALGKSDLDALIVNFPVLANKVLVRLARTIALRLQMRIDAELLGQVDKPEGGKP